MHTYFSELFILHDWFRLWDHLVSNQPSFMYYLVIAYVRYFRGALLEVDKTDDFTVINLYSLIVLFPAKKFCKCVKTFNYCI